MQTYKRNKRIYYYEMKKNPSTCPTHHTCVRVTNRPDILVNVFDLFLQLNVNKDFDAHEKLQ